MKRLEGDEGWLYRGHSIVRRYVAGCDQGFWLIDDSDYERFYTLLSARTAVAMDAYSDGSPLPEPMVQ